MKNQTTIEKISDRELVITRTFDGPARIVFAAWTDPAMFRRWWIPRSIGLELLSCEIDVRVGGKYKLVIRHGANDPMTFHGTYLEVVPNARIVWTNEEAGDAGQVTTVTFEETGGKTRVVVHERYPSKEALAEAGGAEGGMPEAFDQLAELLATSSSSSARRAL